MTMSINDIKRELYKRDKSSADQDVNLHSYVFKKLINKAKTTSHQALPKRMKLSALCKEIGCELPSGIENCMFTHISTSFLTVEEGGVLIITERNAEKYQRNINESLKKGAVAVFVDEELFEKADMDKEEIPLIFVKDGIRSFRNFYKKYRNLYNGKMICITGSVGKTTTKGYIESILKNSFTPFISPASKNAGYQITDNILYKWSNNYDVCVQEVGAMEIGTIEGTSEILEPDISVITNVLPHHLAAYKNFNNLLSDKLSLADNLKSGGIAVVNYDDTSLREYNYNSKVVSFGINTEAEVDYRAVDIHQIGGELSFDIVYGDNKIHVTSHILGEFNTYNILASFAVGKLMGMNDDEIVQGIAGYGSSGIRQNVIEYGQNKFMVDCFNVCNETIINAVDILEDFKVENDGRKIAVVGGENTLGKYRVEKTAELGQALARFDIDEFICFGTSEKTDEALDLYGDAATLYDTLLKCGVNNCRLITSFEALVEYLTANIEPNDVVLFKSIIYLHLPVVIDKAFGTNISLNHNYVLKKSKTKTIKGYTGILYAYMEEAYLTNASKKKLGSDKVVIPNKFGGKEIFGLGKGLFAYSRIKTVDFGKTVKLIGTGAFKECKHLEKVEMPDSVLHIMEGAFKNCTKLEEVRIGAGIRQIDKNAFAGCNHLQTIVLPDKKGIKIEADAIPANVNMEYYKI